MKIDYEGYKLFNEFCCGNASFETLMQHRAYHTVLKHGKHYSNGTSSKRIKRALTEKESPFYGFKHMDIHRELILSTDPLIQFIEKHQELWLDQLAKIYGDIVSQDALNTITICPIGGYDIGIGFNDVVCFNIFHKCYIDNPMELWYMMIHEVSHVIYEKLHKIPKLATIERKNAWLDYFKLFLQNEGYAVYFPLTLRGTAPQSVGDYPTIEDYGVLSDNAEMKKCINGFLIAIGEIEVGTLEKEACIERLFGENRFTYRIGCELIKRILQAYGPAAVKDGFKMDAGEFYDKYIHLLKQN